MCKSATQVYQWRNENRPTRIQSDSNRNDSVISEDEKELMEKNIKKGFDDEYDIRETYEIAYSYEDIANILYGKWALIANNLCILFYLFSCQCSYMTLIKVWTSLSINPIESVIRSNP